MKTTAAPDRHQDAGVTLVEVLVVLVLVGIMAGIVGLNIGSGSRGDIAKQEADLLVARLNRAADDVILTGVPMGFVWGAEGYRFDVYNGEIWVPHPLPVLKEPHLLAGRTRIVGSDGAIVVYRCCRARKGIANASPSCRIGSRHGGPPNTAFQKSGQGWQSARSRLRYTALNSISM